MLPYTQTESNMALRFLGSNEAVGMQNKSLACQDIYSTDTACCYMFNFMGTKVYIKFRICKKRCSVSFGFHKKCRSIYLQNVRSLCLQNHCHTFRTNMLCSSTDKCQRLGVVIGNVLLIIHCIAIYSGLSNKKHQIVMHWHKLIRIKR